MSGALAEGCHIFAFRVYYEDTDAGGIVYHASYLRFAERARTEALRALGVSHTELADHFGLIFVVRRLEVHYVRPARLDDLVEVATVCQRAGPVSVRLGQSIRRVGSGEMLAELAVALAVVSRVDGRPAPLPQRWRAALARLGGPGGMG